MFLRRNHRTRMEVSLDEPLRTDWDGNELLLSDVLGTEGALALWRAAGGEDAFDLVLIGNDGSVRVTEGVAASFTAAEGYAGRVNVEERP